MMRNVNRRRVKKRKRTGEKTKMKFTTVLVIMIIAIALGYLTACFVIGPIFGYNADESPIQIANSSNTQKEESQVVEDGYALQFGVFSTKEAAQELVNSLQQKGVTATIVEADNLYKVISPIIKTKDEAINKLNEIKDKEVEDVFIASF